MATRTFQQALEHLYGLERRGDKLGLEGTRALLGLFGHPERRFRSVHVAGTNGKGSVCAWIERVLRESGARTGLFTSPHLVDFRERIRVIGRWADESWLFESLERIESSPGAEPTFFEVATALGFGWFAARAVEWAVVEVGLGGRLDTTNVIEPELCVITSIGLDHTEILGSTIEAIAAEKAGILKPGVPVVVGPGMEPGALEVIADTARERGAPLLMVEGFDVDRPDAFSHWLARSSFGWGRAPALAEPRGAGAARNAATALTALDALHARGLALTPEGVERGMTSVRWPGRFERCPGTPRLWWDGAHNAHGAEALARAWREAGLPEPSALVLALSRDKDAESMISALVGLGERTRVIATRTRNERALDPERIVAAAARLGRECRVVPEVAHACTQALDGPGREAAAPVLLTGSLFAVGEAMEAFGGAPGADQ